ncbi:Alpha/Beta hydrolase protein [Aspergillus pseudoustus]|uniref:Alpha/Beta hydrolase protein n=1 Tax=Aspergillus pseudoustus TaxID=1810923 RepID=A0ABR4L1G9_9EURO
MQRHFVARNTLCPRPRLEEYRDTHPIVFLSGIVSSENYFFLVLEALASKYRCIKHDIYGLTAHSTIRDVSVKSIINNVLMVMDHLQISRVVLVAIDLGSIVATLIAAKFPARVIGVVAFSPLLLPPGETCTQLECWARAAHNSSYSPIPLQYDPEWDLTICTLADRETLSDFLSMTSMGSQFTVVQRAFIRELIFNQLNASVFSFCTAVVKAQVPSYFEIYCPFLRLVGDHAKCLQSAA